MRVYERNRSRSKLVTWGLAGVMALSLGLTGCGQGTGPDNSGQEPVESVPDSTVETEVSEENARQSFEIEISSKEDFGKIYEDLTASYVLTADIDLGGEVIEPIGHFEPKSDAPEDEETPDVSLAFTGTFNGNGHTLSHFSIDAADKNGVGLFGCVTGEGSWVKDLKVDTIDVKGGNYTGGIVGFADFGSHLEGIELTGENSVEGVFLVGGIAGASHADIINCRAAADVTLTEGYMQGAGIIVGGQEDGNLENCRAEGSVTAGDGCYSIGGLAGCFHNSAYAKDCTAENIVIRTGDGCWLLGGLAGHSGTYEGAPTLVENGTVKNVSIQTGDDSERIGGITGGGFYASAYKEYYPEPSKSDIQSCSVSEFRVSGGRYVGAAVGYSYGTTTVADLDGTMIWNDSESEEPIGADDSVKLEELK